MKNILFCGPYRQKDGWGNASKEYLRALKLTGYNIAARPLYTNRDMFYNDDISSFEDSKEFSGLENKSYDSYDIIIQHCLPHMTKHYGGVKNISLLHLENTIKHTELYYPLSLMDEIWVSTEFEKRMLEESDIKQSISVIKLPCNIEKYGHKTNIEFGEQFKVLESTYNFYFIGESIWRKNLDDLIKAFHGEFNPSENVSLVIKTHHFGKSEQQTLSIIKEKIANIKKEIKMYYYQNMPYKKELIIPEHMPQKKLYELHSVLDCLVVPSRGEGFCIPAFDAIMHGSKVIANENAGSSQFLNEHNSKPIKSYKTPMISPEEYVPLHNFYNNRNYWHQISVCDLKEKMREAYEENKDKDESEEIKKHSRENILPLYSYENVAKEMLEVL